MVDLRIDFLHKKRYYILYDIIQVDVIQFIDIVRRCCVMRGRRKTVKISEAEWSIMKVLWDGCENSDRGMTLGEIVQNLSNTTDWSNTTIRTLIIRLAEKNAVEIDKTTGVYKYYPKTSRSDCVKSEVESFIERVFDNSAYNLMASLVRGGSLSEKEKKEIIVIIEF